MNLRPMGIGEQLDAAFKVCTANFPTLLRVVLFVVVPVQLLSIVILASTTPEDWSANTWDITVDEEETATDEELWTYVAGQGAWLILVLVMQVFATAACFRAIAQAWLGNEVDAAESLRFALKRTPALLWATFLFFLLVGLGFVACFLPGIWLAVLLGLYTPVLLVEGTKGTGALKRSRWLVKDRWWATFAVIALGYLMVSILAALIGALISIPLFLAVDDSSVAGYVIQSIADGIGYVIALPFQAALVAAVYFDLRVRKEGLDLQVLAQRIGADAPAGPAGTDPFGRPYQPPTPAPGAGTATSPSAWPAQPPPERQPWEEQQDWQPPAGWEPPAPGR